MTLHHAPRCHTVDAMNRRGVLALLLALMFALAAGLITWGPVMTNALPKHPGPTPATAWMADALSLGGSVGMVLAGLFGWRSLRPAGTAPLFRPWRFFVGTVALCGLGSGLHHAVGAECARLLSEWCWATGAALLFTGVLADRVSLCFGSRAACIGALAVASGGFVWWATGIAFEGAGDARGLIFVEALPMLGLLAGIASLRPSNRQGGKGMIMLAGYAVARLATVVFDTYFAGTGIIDGQILMQFIVATAVGRFASRESLPQTSGDAETSSARNTSLNTMG